MKIGLIFGLIILVAITIIGLNIADNSYIPTFTDEQMEVICIEEEIK